MINFRSNELISSHAQNMKYSADNVRLTMLNSLLIIPVTITIAGIFILLIIRPLRQLSTKIHRLEQGHFEEKISFSGSKEIKEIADALELMRARLHALELQKSSFIRHISHELKTPLAAIREGTELLYDNSVGSLNTDQQEITNILKESVSRLQNLIEDLLDFNIVLDSTSLQDAEKSELSKIIEQNITLRKLDIQSKQLTVITDLQPLNIQTNVKQLSVILDNLLSNAIKYSPHGGEICITTQIENHEITLMMTDQGPGIEVSYHQKVFDAFYQGTPPIDSHIKSSGLGLTIVKELLMRLNGDIQLASLTTPEHGLKVTLSFPYHFQGKHL
jgi:two-component system, NtrC family, sensor histidine kinase GlrK